MRVLDTLSRRSCKRVSSAVVLISLRTRFRAIAGNYLVMYVNPRHDGNARFIDWRGLIVAAVAVISRHWDDDVFPHHKEMYEVRLL